MVAVEHRVDRFGKARARLVVDALAALLQDDVALRQHDRVGDPQVHHAVRFHAHDELEMLLRDLLVEDRHVLRGVGVVAAAALVDFLAELRPAPGSWCP